MAYPSLNFALSETTDMLHDQVRSFVTAELQPHAAQIGQDNQFPVDMWCRFGEMGLLGITVDEEYGGSALGYLTHAVVMEKISRASASVAFSYGTHSNLYVNQIRRNGSAEQETHCLPALVSGEHIDALVMSEPSAGSDVISMRLRTGRVGDRFVLNGSKMWITSGPDTHTYVIYAKADADKGTHRITVFIVERDWKGFDHGPKLDKLDIRGSDTCKLIFQDIEVPEENVLDAVNGGAKVLMSGLGYERVVLPGGPVGIMQACMNVVAPYIHDRRQFGQSISEFQLVQGKVADMYTAFNASRAYLYAVTTAYDRGETTRKDAVGVTLHGAERATQIALDTTQILGDNSCTNEFPTGRLLRDTKLYEIGTDTSEIRHMLIGCELFNETR